VDLCERFNCLPSDLFNEDPEWIEKMKVVASARNELQMEEERKARRQTN
jgi:hypothetical protein